MDTEGNLRIALAHKRAMRLAARWYLASVAATPLWWTLFYFVQGFRLNYRHGILRLFLSGLFYVFSLSAPFIAACSLAVLPGFALLPRVLRRFPWLDRHAAGPFVLSLALALPAAAAALAMGLGASAGALAYLVEVGALVSPRLGWRGLRRGAFIADVAI